MAVQRGFYAPSGWEGSVPPPAMPPGMEGLEPAQTEPCPHPRPPLSHPGVTTAGKERPPAPAGSGTSSGREAKANCRSRRLLPGLRLQPQASSKRELNAHSVMASRALPGLRCSWGGSSAEPRPRGPIRGSRSCPHPRASPPGSFVPPRLSPVPAHPSNTSFYELLPLSRLWHY